MSTVRQRALALAAVSAALVCNGCATSPTGRTQLKLVPESQLESLGTEAFAEVKREETIETNPQTNAYVQCVAQSIAGVVDSEQQWEVVVFENSDPNAFAVPGGHIGVTTGMLRIANTADQLAAVIAHEMAHVIAEHASERVSQAVAAQGGLEVMNVALSGMETTQRQGLLSALGLGAEVGVLLPFSRAQESEADELGQLYMAQAGYEPEAAIRLWQNMEQASGGAAPEFLSTHPSHGTRMERLRETLPQAQKAHQQSVAGGEAPASRCRQLPATRSARR